jgi:hypothetical protein
MSYVKGKNKEFAKATSGMVTYLGRERVKENKVLTLKGKVNGNRTRIHAHSYLAKYIGSGHLKIK